MKGLVHINILEDFITKQKYTHAKGTECQLAPAGSQSVLPSSAQAFFVGNHTEDVCPGKERGPGEHPEEAVKAIVQE